MEDIKVTIAGLENELEDLLVARKELDVRSEEYAKSLKRQKNIESEIGIYKIAIKADNFFETLSESIPALKGLMASLPSKKEEVIPRLKSVFSELLGGIKIPETEKPVEPEMDKETLALYNAVKILLSEGLEDVALEAMKFKFEHMQTAQITQALEAIRILLKTGDQKSPMVLFVNLFKKKEK